MSKVWTCIKCGWTYYFAKPSNQPTTDFRCNCQDGKPNWRADMHIPH